MATQVVKAPSCWFGAQGSGFELRCWSVATPQSTQAVPVPYLGKIEGLCQEGHPVYNLCQVVVWIELSVVLTPQWWEFK